MVYSDMKFQYKKYHARETSEKKEVVDCLSLWA